MADFPRLVRPRRATLPVLLPALASFGQTGKGQMRSHNQMGHEWSEDWPPLRIDRPENAALLSFIEEAYRNGTVCDLEHLYVPGSGLARHGVGGGSPLVQGASQTGTSIVTDGWTPSTANAVRAGDVLRLAGLPAVFRVTADAASDGAGVVTVPIDPPIPPGFSPADNAALTLTGVKYSCFVVERRAAAAGPGKFWGGLRVTFREAL